MQTEVITLDRSKAQELYRAYQKHLHYSQPIDHEIMRAYKLISQGRLIIKAVESVGKAGLNAEGLPKLALCRADATNVDCRVESDGSAEMLAPGGRRQVGWGRQGLASGLRFRWPAGTFAATTSKWRATAHLPIVPLHLRPARGIENYHVLWEAEWTKTPPRDPYLLRRVGKSDMWLVVAMWDLTEVERAAMAGRL